MNAAEDAITPVMRRLADQFHAQLRKDYKYQEYEAFVVEAMEGNAQTFDEDGRLAG